MGAQCFVSTRLAKKQAADGTEITWRLDHLDTEAPITTPVIFNTLIRRLSSQMADLPATLNAKEFARSWDQCGVWPGRLSRVCFRQRSLRGVAGQTAFTSRTIEENSAIRLLRLAIDNVGHAQPRPPTPRPRRRSSTTSTAPTSTVTAVAAQQAYFL